MNKTEILACLSKISLEDDDKSFKDLYRFYFRKLFRFCTGIVHSKQSAEEIVHNVFINLWEHRSRACKIENPDVYLYVAVKNNSLDYLRKNRVSHTIDISELSNEYFVLTVNPESLLVTEEMRKMIADAVEQLPPRCRQIFRLIKEDGLKYKDVAAILNLSIKTVEAQMAIAIQKLTTAVLIYTKEETLEKS